MKSSVWKGIAAISVLGIIICLLMLSLLKGKNEHSVEAQQTFSFYETEEAISFEEALAQSATAIRELIEKSKEEAGAAARETSNHIGEVVEKAAQAAGEGITATYVQGHLAIGIDREAVKGLFGEHYKEITHNIEDDQAHLNEEEGNDVETGEEVTADERTTLWRYDFLQDATYEISSNDMMPDIDGFEKGSVQAQLFITWNEQFTLQEYAFYQVNEAGELWEVILAADGEERAGVYCQTNCA